MVKPYLCGEVIELLSNRGQRRATAGTGIRTADEYVRTVVDVAGGNDRDALMKAAAGTLVYHNDDMNIQKEAITSGTAIEQFCKDIGADMPPHTLMAFENIITTPKKDRDGDILRTQGAEPDPNMPLLWQHMPAMPIGKMLKVLDHTKRRLLVASAIVDSPLGHDTAVLIEFGALRISHGFRIFEFDELKKEDDEPWPGLDIKRFEIMEESVVSVPSNTDALITAFSSGKLCDPTVKRWAKGYSETRRLIVPVVIGLDDDGKAVSIETGKIVMGDKGKTAVPDFAKEVEERADDVKDGRVLSKANEGKLRKAADMIGEVLETVASNEDEERTTATTTELAVDLSKTILTAGKDDLPAMKQLRDILNHTIETIE